MGRLNRIEKLQLYSRGSTEFLCNEQEVEDDVLGFLVTRGSNRRQGEDRVGELKTLNSCKELVVVDNLLADVINGPKSTWGKLCAILFTSVWLYFLPGRSVSHQRPETITKLPETETSRDNKKRVIMEGLLERNHHLQRALNFPLER